MGGTRLCGGYTLTDEEEHNYVITNISRQMEVKCDGKEHVVMKSGGNQGRLLEEVMFKLRPVG